MTLEITSVVCGVGSEVDCDELDPGCAAIDGDDCSGLVVVSGEGSVFARGDGNV